MRVSTGRYKGRELEYPRAGLRPTKAITRQAMFNIVGSRVRGAKVCDLYAGGGSLGIEALSRGAASAVFVEQQATVRDLEVMQTTLSAQILQLGEQMRNGFSAIQAKVDGIDVKVDNLEGALESRTAELLAVIAAESRDIKQQGRALHEDLVARIKAIGGR